jgi:hypothetical protein
MKNVAKRIRHELNHMSDGDDTITRRSLHMNNRSNHSFRIEVQRQRTNDRLLRQTSLSFRETGHESIPQSKSSKTLDVHYNGPSLRNGVEA